MASKQSTKIGEYLIEISTEEQVALTRYFDNVDEGYLAIAKSRNIDVSKLSHPSEIREILFGDNRKKSHLTAGEYEISGSDDCRGGKDYRVIQRFQEPSDMLRHLADIYGITDEVDTSAWDELSFAKAIITFFDGKEQALRQKKFYDNNRTSALFAYCDYVEEKTDINPHSYRDRFIKDLYSNKTPIFIGTTEELALNEMPNISADGDRYFNLYHATEKDLDNVCKSLALAPCSGVLLDNIDKVPDIDSKDYVFALKIRDFIVAAIERKQYKSESGVIDFSEYRVGAKCTTKPYNILSDEIQYNYQTYLSK